MGRRRLQHILQFIDDPKIEHNFRELAFVIDGLRMASFPFILTSQYGHNLHAAVAAAATFGIQVVIVDGSCVLSATLDLGAWRGLTILGAGGGSYTSGYLGCISIASGFCIKAEAAYRLRFINLQIWSSSGADPGGIKFIGGNDHLVFGCYFPANMKGKCVSLTDTSRLVVGACTSRLVGKNTWFLYVQAGSEDSRVAAFGNINYQTTANVSPYDIYGDEVAIVGNYSRAGGAAHAVALQASATYCSVVGNSFHAQSVLNLGGGTNVIAYNA